MNTYPIAAECEAAFRFASRSSESLLVTDEEVVPYYEIWKRIGEREPLLQRVPQMYRNPTWRSLTIYTSNPTVIAAWEGGTLETGDAVMDQVIENLGFPELRQRTIAPQGEAAFQFYADSIYNEELTEQRLRQANSRLAPPVLVSGNDGTWSWQTNDAGEQIARVDFRLGWGDCGAGCAGYRYLVAFGSVDGLVEVYEKGGSAPPGYLDLAPSTRPLSELREKLLR